MLNFEEFLNLNMKELLQKVPKLEDFLRNNELKYSYENIFLKDYFNSFNENFYRDKASSKEILSKSMYEYFINILKQEKEKSLLKVNKITIIS
jgi:hypothetical protein